MIYLAPLVIGLSIEFTGEVTGVIEQGEPIDIISGDLITVGVNYDPVPGQLVNQLWQFELPAGELRYQVNDFEARHVGISIVLGGPFQSLRTRQGAVLEGDGRDVYSTITLFGSQRHGLIAIEEGPLIEYRIGDSVSLPEPTILWQLLFLVPFLYKRETR